MGENCQKPGPSVTKTGSSSTPKPQVRPCNGCGLGVFQGRLISEKLLISRHNAQGPRPCRSGPCERQPAAPLP
ncbi:hypothetical protein BRN52_02835 [Xanthomonas oryzae pv. oryzae]|nr:hypothetical protein BRN52_02835 [Xanthomonas oryzae pv. oryzae]AXM37718.1 hypothetical protein BRM84_22165 [Xanthomonas oryzae pv. oryzae]AXM38782.1 hypothetical protein BRN51_02805 [Xanthomonas oryzae pv. oryzae]AXQ10955.1 hypothetical protein BCR61_22780 [Xanthomonas oryzae pv. oryzae]AXQ76884.1 hypothetical protein BXU03_22450 [Xanthomonas oryzae pv. oryzae]